MGERKRSHGADDENLARRAPCCTRHGGWRFPRRDGKQHLGPNEADERTDANENGWHHAGAEREDADADGLQPRRKHYRPQRSSAFRDHADELLVSKHAKKQRVFDLERRYFNELLPVRENVHLFILLVFLRWFGRCTNGNATSSDRVALMIETPDAQLIFNVGPTLEKIGIKVDPLLDEKQAGGAEAEAEDEIPETSFTVKRVMIEDGADINKVGSSYPVLNLTIVSPIFNFTYKEAEDGKSEYETCTLIKGKNASEISVIAPQAAVSSTFSPNMNIETQDDIMAAAAELFQSSPLGVKSPDDPLEASLHLSLVSSSTGKTSLVKAEKLFSLKVPPQWMESFASSQEGDIECSTKQCSMTDSSCLFEF